MSQGAGGFGSQGSTKRALKAVRSIVVSQIIQAEPQSDDGPVVLNSHPIESFVTCAVLKEHTDAPKKIEIWDSTGSIDLRVPSNRELPEDVEDHVGEYVNVYGHFRIFAGKKIIDFDRVEFDLKPYQFLYHEVFAAREWYHYTDVLPLDEKSLAEAKTEGEKPKAESGLFVDEDPNWELKQRITEIVRGADENDDEASTEYIARELCIAEDTLNPLLLNLANEGTIYEVAGCYRISELS